MQANTPHDRLKILREYTGYNTAADFARAVGIEEGTYRSHENGNRGVKFNVALNYVALFDVGNTNEVATWVMSGDPQPDFLIQNADGKTTVFVEAKLSKPRIKKTTNQTIPEVDLRAGMGGPGLAEEQNGYDHGGNSITVDAQKDEGWGIPDNYLSGELHVQRSGLYVVEVQGDSMEPSLQTGDRVMVDTGDTRPRNGIFAVRDSYGVQVKSIQPVHGSDPAMIRVISDNEKYSTEDWPLEDHTIIGRVVGMIRKM